MDTGFMEHQQEKTIKPDKPLGVRILAIVAIVGGIFGLLGGIVALMPSSAEPMWLGGLIVAYSILLLILGVGYWIRKNWSWTLGIALYVIAIPVGVAEILYAGSGWAGGVVRIIVSLPILFYLTRAQVRRFFRGA